MIWCIRILGVLALIFFGVPFFYWFAEDDVMNMLQSLGGIFLVGYGWVYFEDRYSRKKHGL